MRLAEIARLERCRRLRIDHREYWSELIEWIDCPHSRRFEISDISSGNRESMRQRRRGNQPIYNRKRSDRCNPAPAFRNFFGYGEDILVVVGVNLREPAFEFRTLVGGLLSKKLDAPADFAE